SHQGNGPIHWSLSGGLVGPYPGPFRLIIIPALSHELPPRALGRIPGQYLVQIARYALGIPARSLRRHRDAGNWQAGLPQHFYSLL
ncbi:MAG: hypothetical protein KGM95_01460, partial [Betaproteobacteria bacterium]|nr:hypothetical protein [Betaproteobacteria bacterium]